MKQPHERAWRAPAAAGLRPAWSDLLAGLSLAGVLLSGAVAYAGIAGVAPLHALLATLAGLVVYPLFGTSRFAAVAPTSSAAAVFASALAAGGPAMAYALVGLTGALFVAAAVLRAGFLGAYISRAVLRGFAWALALTIVLRQLPQIAGVHVAATQSGALAWELLAQAPRWHGPSLVLGAAALALWFGLGHGLRRRPFVPTVLVVLALGVAASAALGLGARGVAMVGDIALQPPAWRLPALNAEHWLRAAELAPALLLILFAESWGSVRALALQAGDRVDANRELAALGMANLACGRLQGLPVGAGLSAASASFAAGARSLWAGVAAALALAGLLWLTRPALALLPQPVVAAVVVGSLARGLWPRALLRSLRLEQDAWLAAAAAAGVLLGGALPGMLLAVALSLLAAIRRFAQPLVSELGRLPGTRNYVDRATHPEAQAVDGTLIMRPEEPLFFANAEQVCAVARRRAEAVGARRVVLSLEVCDDLDGTALEALDEFAVDLHRLGAELLLARVKDRPRTAMQRLGDGIFPMFWSVDDAVRAGATADPPAAGPSPGRR
ncbi:SulP family inorganic anion transporter [Xylophilus sp.]|uniref:SulP family inorganic anion transporter n=1 Tax=Xylophilus sp. TaxID=2653893 RepID=UPI0013BE0C40|nr:SulP family inorganic anion transporter [Xylophilus sp.]KAF1047530.1 MAG: putative sulfate transporter [Xylophilus sp.]